MFKSKLDGSWVVVCDACRRELELQDNVLSKQKDYVIIGDPVNGTLLVCKDCLDYSHEVTDVPDI